MSGTDLAWVREANGIQVDVAGALPPGLTLVLMHPVRTADPGPPGGTATPALYGAGVFSKLRPHMYYRRDWGADESWRSGDPTYNHTIKQVHVHHTVNSNGYGKGDVPGLIRGIYRYHTHSLGWSDIGYNFLVDRFGRMWVGRAGGPRRPVRGAHTLGFNSQSTGVSVIGNFDAVSPNRATLNAIASLAAWKLARYDRDPRGRIWVKSEGSDKFPAGEVVRLPVIDGHRDTNDTACPGGHLYQALPKIRRKAKRRIEQASGEDRSSA